jgi:Double zinc ribbon
MALVRTSSNYCGYCGNRLPQVAQLELTVCGVCGNKIPTSANFCPQCGEDTRDPKRLKMRMRFSWLKDVEKRYASDQTLFRAGGLPGAEDDKEGPVFDKAKKAKDTDEPVMVNVILRERRGEIGSIPWALIEPDGAIEYVYP